MRLFKALVFIALYCTSSWVFCAENKLRVHGNQLFDHNDKPVTLRGFGLGGWLMPEGYMVEFPKPYQSPTGIWNAVVDLTDETTAKKIFELYEKNYVTESDIKAIKQWGFNSLRVAFNSHRLIPRQKQRVGKPLVYDDSGLTLLDKVVKWASKYELYVVLDMHGAPGAQSIHNIADAIEGALLWEKPDIYWPRTIQLWRDLATRYRDNPWVIGFDLLNEPMLPGTEELGGEKQAQHDNTALRELYKKITAAIREVDEGKKIVFVEGGFWANNFNDMLPPWDSNLVYTFHQYPPPLHKETFPTTLLAIMEKGYPVWFGEGGENWNKLKWNEWLEFNAAFTSMLEKETVGWNWWTTKKFTRVTQPWQCHLPEGFAKIKNYLSDNGPKPEKREAKRILMQFAENLATDKCTLVPEMVRSIGGKL